MRQESIRNIAIIAHVDHGKTTLVDKLLEATNVFSSHQEVDDCVLDSNDLERERGITILSKNISIKYKDVKINVIDTPGHADFGGEVERVLKMADGVLLLVDAFEGPMPQTRFVLKKALSHGLKPLVVVNKIDRQGARPHEALDEVFSLFIDLDANDEQLDFPVIYASGVNGYARLDPDDDNMDMTPLLDAVLEHIPGPEVNIDGPTALQTCTLDYSSYVGRIAIGRIYSGTIKANQQVKVIANDGSERNGRIKQVFTFESLGRKEVKEAQAGDIVAVVGIEDTDIGDTITDPENPIKLDPIELEAPTISMVFSANSSPFVGTEGDKVTSRQLKDRLFKEAEGNISLVMEETPDRDGIIVSGRGILHLSVLIETLRREGFELQVARPHVIFHEENGQKLEPIELAVVDVPGLYAGKVIELMGSRLGEMIEMNEKGALTHLEFKIPARGLMGLRTRILNATKGEGIMFHTFSEYGAFKGPLPKRPNGVMISMQSGKALAFALDALEARGRLFVPPGTKCYEGMIVGEHSKDNDITVNQAKGKQLTNMRSSGSDGTVQLAPATKFTLEENLEYIEEDELLEVTPESMRLRKRFLTENERKQAMRAKAK